MIAEDEDVLDLLQAGRVHLGVVRAQPRLPPDLAVARLQVEAQMAIFLHQDHPLAARSQVSEAQLGELRQLRLNTVETRQPLPAGRTGRPQLICCCWRWRSRGLAGAYCRAGWCSSLVIRSCASCRCRAGRSISRWMSSGRGAIRRARPAAG